MTSPILEKVKKCVLALFEFNSSHYTTFETKLAELIELRRVLIQRLRPVFEDPTFPMLEDELHRSSSRTLNPYISQDIRSLLETSGFKLASKPKEMETLLNDGQFNAQAISQVVEAIVSNPVIGVTAPTGTGKSTALIGGIKASCDCVFVVEPTVFAVENLAGYMRKTLGAEMVGSASEGNVRYANSRITAIRGGSKGPQTPIVYATSGHIRRLFLDLVKVGLKSQWTEDFVFCDVLVLDEVHTGSLDNDVIMALYKLMASQTVMPRLVFSSATLSSDGLKLFPSIPILRFSVQKFPVSLEYHPQRFNVGDRKLNEAVAEVVATKHRIRPLTENLWLIFCSGTGEVLATVNALTRLAPELETIAIYGALGYDVIQTRLGTPIPEGKRRVIVSTNIAESAVTLEGLSGIFDTMVEKYTETSQAGGSLLVQNFIAKSSAQQRSGRTGRTCPGFAYRMLPEADFQALPEHRPNEIERVPIHSMILELLEARVDPLTLFEGSLGVDRFEATLPLLERLGMYRPEPFEMTALGRFAPQVPFSVRGAAILFAALEAGLDAFPVLVLLALIEAYHPPYFYYPPKKPEVSQAAHKEATRKYYEEHFKAYEGPTDLHVLLAIFTDIFESLGTLRPRPSDLARFSVSRSFNNKKISEMLRLLDQGSRALRSLGKTVRPCVFDPDTLLGSLSPILNRVDSDLMMTKQTSQNYARVSDGTFFHLDDRQPLREGPLAEEILGLVSQTIRTSRSLSNIVSLTFPTNFKPPPAKVSELPRLPMVLPPFIPKRFGLPEGYQPIEDLEGELALLNPDD